MRTRDSASAHDLPERGFLRETEGGVKGNHTGIGFQSIFGIGDLPQGRVSSVKGALQQTRRDSERRGKFNEHRISRGEGALVIVKGKKQVKGLGRLERRGTYRRQQKEKGLQGRQ